MFHILPVVPDGVSVCIQSFFLKTTPIKSMKGVSYMRKKQQNITFRTTEEEYRMIKEKAMSLNLTVTDFIVKSCREKEVIGVIKKEK